MRVLVTGAGGFVGQHLCRELIDDHVSVRALVRDRSRAPLLSGVDLHLGDVNDAPSIRAALTDVDAVVHLAARVHVMRDTATDPLAEFRRINVEGTRTLMAAARNAGVRHMVFSSSVKAVGQASTSPWNTDTPPLPVDAYGTSKLEAEQLLASQPAGVPVVSMLRFPLLYGPGMKGNMLRLFSIIAHGWPVPVGSTDNARSMLYVGNAVAAIKRALDRAADAPWSETASGPFFVADGPGQSTAVIAREIANALDAPSRIVRLPQAALRALARIADPLTAGRVGAALDRLLGSLEVDEKEFEREYSFRPPYTREQGLEITARWFLQS